MKTSFWQDYIGSIGKTEKKILGGALGLARKGFEAVDKRVFPKSYTEDKAAFQRIKLNKKKMMSSDGYMYMK